MKNKHLIHRLKLIASFSLAIFLLIIISAYWLITFFFLARKAPFIDVENLPSHTTDILLGIISILLGIVLSLLFKKYVLNPVYDIYEALDEISSGNYSVKINPSGIPLIKNLSKKINSTVLELESVENMRNDFIDNFSHEFKTPIISISGFAKMLKNDELSNSEKNEYLEIIIDESERLATLATNVLGLTKLDSQMVLTDVCQFNITEQIRLAVVILANKWSKKNIEISFEGEDYLIAGNKETLKQLWINVIDNAIKFSPEGSTIEITVSKHNKNITVQIRDHGKGMDETTVRHAFDKFFQGDVAHKANGNGIGLAMAKRICNLHNGDIIIKSTGPTGTVFEITLPCDMK